MKDLGAFRKLNETVEVSQAVMNGAQTFEVLVGGYRLLVTCIDDHTMMVWLR